METHSYLFSGYQSLRGIRWLESPFTVRDISLSALRAHTKRAIFCLLRSTFFSGRSKSAPTEVHEEELDVLRAPSRFLRASLKSSHPYRCMTPILSSFLVHTIFALPPLQDIPSWWLHYRERTVRTRNVRKSHRPYLYISLLILSFAIYLHASISLCACIAL